MQCSRSLKVQRVNAEMNTDPGILCFQHCGRKVFCFELPRACPCCGTSLEVAQFGMLPFRVPYPFVRAEQYPCSVIIRPTSGDFLNDYLNSMDLHIGVTDSTGAVIEYDKSGLQRHSAKRWQQCLILDQLSEEFAELWDQALEVVVQQTRWSSRNYNEISLNCYSFVLTFLQLLQLGRLSKAANSKTLFCEEFIVPRTTAAGKYISLYRKLRHGGCFIQNSRKTDSPTYPESVPSR